MLFGILLYRVISVKKDDLEESQILSSDIFKDARMSICDGTLTNTGVVLQIDNQSEEYSLGFGEGFGLEQMIGNDWYKVPMLIDSVAYDSVKYYISPREIRIYQFDWEGLYKLSSGHYRVVKQVELCNAFAEEFKPGENVEEGFKTLYWLVAEFDMN